MKMLPTIAQAPASLMQRQTDPLSMHLLGTATKAKIQLLNSESCGKPTQ
jgi:hypothetical protein